MENINIEYIFETPKQVIFADPDNPGEWIAGIAYREEIICACCGGIFEISDVVDAAIENGVINAIYPYEDWVDFAAEITGGEMPEGLRFADGDRIVEDESEEGRAMADLEAEEAEAAEGYAHYFKELESVEETASAPSFQDTWNW